MVVALRWGRTGSGALARSCDPAVGRSTTLSRGLLAEVELQLIYVHVDRADNGHRGGDPRGRLRGSLGHPVEVVDEVAEPVRAEGLEVHLSCFGVDVGKPRPGDGTQTRAPQHRREAAQQPLPFHYLERMVHDLDGRLDLTFCDGGVLRSFLGDGMGGFQDIKASLGTGNLHHMVATDWDADGDLDVWVSNRTAPTVQVFENRWGSRVGDFIALNLQGARANRDAAGARVTILLKGEEQAPLTRTVRLGEGFQSQSSKRLHFGLGKNATISSVTVRWPGPTHATETFSGVEINKFHLLVEGSGQARILQPRGARFDRSKV